MSGSLSNPPRNLNPPGVADVMSLQAAMDGAQLCALGYHAWLPWITNPSGRSWHTFCSRCKHEEQYDL